MNYPQDFLKQLDLFPHKTKYVRITALDCYDRTVQRLEGVATGGSLSISSGSKLQRTCSLTLQADANNAIINDEYWGLQHRFILEIGLKNEINPQYEDVIWFKQGTFMISSFSYSKNASSITVSINGKDKMAKLDGTMGGTLGASVVFDVMDEQLDDGSWLIKKLPLYDIIYNAVLQYGNELPQNIIINDLEESGYELWEYAGIDPMYILVNEQEQVVQIYFDGEGEVYDIDNNQMLLSEIPQYYILNPLMKSQNNNATQIKTSIDTTDKFFVVKIITGETVGYHETTLIYPSDLILGEKDTVVSLLDKIVTILGPQPFEYFYDIDGRFIFQKQQYFLKDLIVTDISKSLAEPIMLVPDYSYKFEDLKLISQIGVNPNINNIKNDYILYGEKETADKTKIILHIRYAIDKKPQYDYTSLPWVSDQGHIYPSVTYRLQDWDWREILYRMAQDFYRHQTESDFYHQVQNYNPWAIDGITGYEQYYIDLYSFWRDLYNPEPSPEDVDKYYGILEQYPERKYWNKMVYDNPGGLVYWFDFLDTSGDWENISISKIGRRPNVNKNKFTSIYNLSAPELQFVLEGETPIANNAYTNIYLPKKYEELFRMSSQTNSGLTLLTSDLNNYTSQANSLSVTVIPMYHLMPNSRVYVEGYGDYRVGNIQVQLTPNATMSLQLNKLTNEFIKEVI